MTVELPSGAAGHDHEAVATSAPEALALLSSGDVAGAERALRGHLNRDPLDSVALAKLAEIVRDQGRLSESAWLFRRVLLAAPHAYAARIALAHVLQQQGDLHRALEQVESLPSFVRSTLEVRTFEAALLGLVGRYERQIPIYEELLGKHRKDAGLWMSLGSALKYAGKTAEAIRALRRSVSIQTTYGEGWWALSEMKTFRFAPHDIAVMRKALGGKITSTDALHLHFALGKALGDCGHYEQSFWHYSEGNRIRAASFTSAQMNLDRLANEIDQNIATFDSALLGRVGSVGHSSRDPIFIVGIQRSGSTLVEQILASHSLIEGTAELDAMLYIWTALVQAGETAGRSVWEEIRSLEPQRLRDIGADYIARTRPFRASDRPIFIDKRPANWMYVGLIRLALPNAKIIDARRNPMACGFSNFKQHYAGGASFSYSLPLIGRYYREYLRLMNHFDQVQPGSVHHVLNESLIADPECEIRRLIEFVGVPFEPSCLEFHRNRRTVRSASAEQVRRPINRDGVDEWRHYEAWLDPLKQALGPALETWATVDR